MKADHVAGAAFIALGVVVFAISGELPFGTLSAPGAGMMPKAVTTLMTLFGVLVMSANLVFDYAKVRAVVEDRRSMIGALSAGLRFVRRNAAAVIGLYALNSLAFLAVLLLYYLAAPGAAADALAFAIGQLFIVLKVIIRLQFAASQTALFQGRLAHAGYTARPVARFRRASSILAGTESGSRRRISLNSAAASSGF